MFVLKERPAYFWAVKFELQSADGKYEPHEFQAEFKRVPQSRIDKLFEDLKDIAASGMSDDAIVKEMMIGWRDVNDAEGKPVLFNSDTLAQLLEVPRLRAAIVKSFFESLSGIPLKN